MNLLSLRSNLNRSVLSILDGEATSLNKSSNTSRGVEGRDSCTSISELLGESSLRNELNLKFSLQILFLEQLVLTNIRRDHSLDLVLLKEETEASIVNSCIVRHTGQVFCSVSLERLDEVLRDSTETEASNSNGCSIRDFLGGLLSSGNDLSGEASHGRSMNLG